MEHPIPLTMLNDFIFCPASIYFHQIDESSNNLSGKSLYQINGSAAHESVDSNRYSSSSNVLQGLTVFSSKYNIIGKIDVFDIGLGLLTERKRTIKRTYDGYMFQLYGQYFGLTEFGYHVERMRLHSLTDNRNYPVALPENNREMLEKFEKTVNDISSFSLSSFRQTNIEKCKMCVYRFLCPYEKEDNSNDEQK